MISKNDYVGEILLSPDEGFFYAAYGSKGLLINVSAVMDRYYEQFDMDYNTKFWKAYWSRRNGNE